MNRSRIDRAPWPSLPGRRALLLLVCVLAVPVGAGAQVPDTLRRDTVYEVEPIGVRAVRPTTTTGGVSAVVVKLDSVRLRPAPLLEDVLRELPLVQVRTNSRGEAQLALRGAEARQVAILLDGVPITLGWDHRADLSVVPLTAARSVTLVRGMSSILHGPNVLGGAVEIGLGAAAIGAPEPLRLAAGMDAQGGYSIAAQTGVASDLDASRLVMRAGAGHRESPGFPTPAGVETVYPALAAGDLRVNSQSALSDGFVSARLAAGGAWVAVTATGYTAERGVPPELTEERPRLWRYPEASRALGIVTGGTGPARTPLGTGDLTVSVGIDAGRTVIHDHLPPPDPAGPETEPGAFFATVDEREASDQRTLTARLVGQHSVGAAARVRAALTYADIRHDEVITTGLAFGSPENRPAGYRQRLWSAGAELEVPLPDIGPLGGGRVSGGVAWDGADTPETGGAGPGRTIDEWGARLGVSGTTRGGGALLHAAVSRRGRFPALREMYSRALGRFEPNPGLRPEILTAAEAGLTTRSGPLDVQVVGFHQQLEEAIARGPAPAGSTARFQRVNRDAIRSTGLEVLAGYSVGRFRAETELTVQDVDAIVRDADAAGRVRAEYEPEVVAGIGGSFPLPLGAEAGAEVEYVGRQYCATPVDATERYARLPPSTRTDVQLARTFELARGAGLSRLGVEVAAENLTDALIYDQCGLPRPGRVLRLQLRLR